MSEPRRAPRPAVVLRADGGATIGGGHIIRAGVLAAALSRAGCDVHLLTKDDDWTRTMLDNFSGKVHFIRSTDNESLIVRKTISRLDAHLTILDVRDTSEEYVRYLQESAAPVVTIDDRGRGAKIADASFSGGMAARREKSAYHGPAYAILDPSIAELRKASRTPDRISTAVVFFGTFDPKGHGRWFPGVIDAFPDISFLWFTREARAPAKNLRTANMDHGKFLSSLAESDLAIIAGGITLYEAAALGRPAIVLPEAPHENDQASLMAALGAANAVIPPSAARTAAALTSLVENPAAAAAMSRCATAAVDGRGANRFVELAKSLMARARPHGE